MKHTAKLLLLFSLLLVLFSCSKETLSPEVSEYLTQTQRTEYYKEPAFKDKMVLALQKSNAIKLQGFWDSHDDFGLKAYHMTIDLMGEDVVANGLDWFDWEYNYVTVVAASRRVRTFWSMFYDIIANCNSYINGNPEPDATGANFFAMRGIAYWHLANFYQATYKGAESKPAVPLVLKDEDTMLARNTVQEIYDQAIKDLTIGVEYGVATKDHTDVDKFVAAAYLAKLYAHMEDWANVEKYAKIASEGGTDIVLTYPPSWNVNNADVLWGFDVTAATSTSWASFYSHNDPTNGNYCGNGQRRLIYTWLYDQIGDKDARKKLFIDKELFPAIDKENRDGALANYTSLKFKVTHQDNLNSDYVYLRVQDPILLEIEAINELGRTSDAKAKLEEFVKKRDPEYSAPATQNELRDEIRVQRRIELWGEGNGVWDLKRWKLEVNRSKASVKGTPSNHVQTEFQIKDPNAIENIHCLPQGQLDINKNLVQDDRPI